MFGETLSTVASLEEEPFAFDDAAQFSLELSGLPREDERRKALQELLDLLELSLVGVFGNLSHRAAAPGVRCPRGCHNPSPISLTCPRGVARAYTMAGWLCNICRIRRDEARLLTA